MLGEFNKHKFAVLLKKAVGSPARGINEYGRQAGVSGSYISRFLYPLSSRPQEKWVKVPPGAEVIKKLAACAANGVTYYQLMIAAGHLPDDKTTPVEPTSEEWREVAADHIVKTDMLSGRAKKIEEKIILFDRISENKNGNRRKNRNKNKNGSCRAADENALISYDYHRLTWFPPSTAE